MTSVTSPRRWDADALGAVIQLLRVSSREVELHVNGGSMGSSIPDGSLIRIEARDRHDYRPGQVIAYLAGQAFVVHRVVYAGPCRGPKRYLLTQGDRGVLCDPPVELPSVLGVVTGCQIDGTWRALPARPARGFLKGVLARTLAAAFALCMRASVPGTQWLAQELMTRSGPLVRSCGTRR